MENLTQEERKALAVVFAEIFIKLPVAEHDSILTGQLYYEELMAIQIHTLGRLQSGDEHLHALSRLQQCSPTCLVSSIGNRMEVNNVTRFEFYKIQRP